MNGSTNEKGLAATNDQPRESSTNTAIVGQADDERNEAAALSAHLSVRGFTLHELACGGFLVARWDRTMHCSDLQQVAGFLRRLGVPQ